MRKTEEIYILVHVDPVLSCPVNSVTNCDPLPFIISIRAGIVIMLPVY